MFSRCLFLSNSHEEVEAETIKKLGQLRNAPTSTLSSSPEPCGGARRGGCISYRSACEPRSVEWDGPWMSFPTPPRLWTRA